MNVEIGAEAAQFPEKEYINEIAVAVCVLLIWSNKKKWSSWYFRQGALHAIYDKHHEIFQGPYSYSKVEH